MLISIRLCEISSPPLCLDESKFFIHALIKQLRIVQYFCINLAFGNACTDFLICMFQLKPLIIILNIFSDFDVFKNVFIIFSLFYCQLHFISNLPITPSVLRDGIKYICFWFILTIFCAFFTASFTTRYSCSFIWYYNWH